MLKQVIVYEVTFETYKRYVVSTLQDLHDDYVDWNNTIFDTREEAINFASTFCSHFGIREFKYEFHSIGE
jgi:hypothetical protein